MTSNPASAPALHQGLDQIIDTRQQLSRKSLTQRLEMCFWNVLPARCSASTHVQHLHTNCKPALAGAAAHTSSGPGGCWGKQFFTLENRKQTFTLLRFSAGRLCGHSPCGCLIEVVAEALTKPVLISPSLKPRLCVRKAGLV